jgi:PilZ domain
MDERRNAARRRCLLGARVVFNNRESTISCTVKNVSDSGALLVFGENNPFVPEAAELLLDNQRTMAAGHIVWRSQTKIGFKFLEPQTLSTTSVVSQGLLADLPTPRDRVVH